jgi:hypothetical protein
MSGASNAGALRPKERILRKYLVPAAVMIESDDSEEVTALVRRGDEIGLGVKHNGVRLTALTLVGTPRLDQIDDAPVEDSDHTDDSSNGAPADHGEHAGPARELHAATGDRPATLDRLLDYVADNLPANVVEVLAATPPPTGREAVIANAIGPTMLFGLQDAELVGEPGRQRIEDWIKWISETVAALPLAPQPSVEAQSRQGDAVE